MEKAQSLIEYTLLLAVIIALIAAALYTPVTGIKEKLNSTYNKMGLAIVDVTNNLTTQVFGIK